MREGHRGRAGTTGTIATRVFPPQYARIHEELADDCKLFEFNELAAQLAVENPRQAGWKMETTGLEHHFT